MGEKRLYGLDRLWSGTNGDNFLIVNSPDNRRVAVHIRKDGEEAVEYCSQTNLHNALLQASQMQLKQKTYVLEVDVPGHTIDDLIKGQGHSLEVVKENGRVFIYLKDGEDNRVLSHSSGNFSEAYAHLRACEVYLPQLEASLLEHVLADVSKLPDKSPTNGESTPQAKVGTLAHWPEEAKK